MKADKLQRGQFTFYASYLSAVEELPKCRRYEALLGILRYGLYGEEPGLQGTAACVFQAVRPHLAAGRAKAAYRLRKNAEADEAPPAVHPAVQM